MSTNLWLRSTALALTVVATACSGPAASTPLTLPDSQSGPEVARVTDAKAAADTGIAVIADSDADATGDTATQDATSDGVPDPDAASTSDTLADAPIDTNKPGFNYECKPLTVEPCVTACGSAGTRKCLKEWGPCVPPDESCNNCTDDDCDGVTNEGCPAKPECGPPTVACPVAQIAVAEGTEVGTGTVLHLTAAGSAAAGGGKIVKWAWSVQAPAGASVAFLPDAATAAPTFLIDAAGQYLFQLQLWDDKGVAACTPALATVVVEPYPPQPPSIGCADGTREGFLDSNAYPQIAGCAGAWDQPGITPDAVKPTCGNQGGNSGAKPTGQGCAAPDLCAVGWHVCKTWQDVAQKSPTGCAGATPANAAPKSLFFALRQPSVNGSVCGKWGDGFNDVFGCGNLGTTLAPDKACGPLDRVLASTQPNACGFNEAEPNLGPWQCLGSGKSDLNEGANVTKKACQGGSCQYDGKAVGPADKGGVLCCQGG